MKCAKISCCFCMILLFMVIIGNVSVAETNSTYEGETVYELQAVYPLSLIYMSNLGLEMQGKYYQKPNFYLGWYFPIRFIFPFEPKYMLGSIDPIDSDIQVKLMGTAGYTIQNEYFSFDTCLLAGWRYWYLKTRVINPADNIDICYESAAISFEVGMMPKIRWKFGESFKFKNNLSCLSIDFSTYWPFTDDFLYSVSRMEVVLGLSYTF